MPRTPKPYQLSSTVIASSVGAGVMCLAAEGVGRTYRLHAERPGPETNQRVTAPRLDGRARDEERARRADLPSGAAHVIAPVEAASPLIMVRIDGPIEQRAGYHDPCGGWSDGHDAIADRLCAAFAEGDVFLVVDSPGGAAAGLQQAVERALAAKAEQGRRVTVYADEMVGSAAMWWACAVGDEMFIPMAGQVGSIGARGEHTDVSGMMEKEGLKKTYFADPPDKIALAPEFPLGAVGAARGNRDVKTAADAFRAAVCASPIGLRNGLTPEFLFDLGADMLTGEAAVTAGLADGVESIETVTAYAMGLAESGGAKDIEARATATKQTTGAARAKGDRAMSLRSEGAEPEKKDPEDEPEGERGRDIPTACAACKVENDKDAKFCKGCGESMATAAEEEEEPPPSSKPMPGKASALPTSERAQAPAKMSAEATLASILGAAGESPLALKTAAIGLRQIKDTAIGITGQTEPGAIVGTLLTMPDRLARADMAATNEKKRAQDADRRARRDLASRLNKLGLDAWPRTAIFADAIDPSTNATISPPPLTKTIARWDLSEFRGYVEGFEKKAKPRTPFEAKREPAREGAAEHAGREGATAGGPPALAANGEPTPAQIEAAKTHPSVLNMFRAPNNTHTIDAIAKNFVINAARNGVALGGSA